MNGSSKPKSRFNLHLVFLDYPSIIYVLLLFFTGFTWSKLLVLVLLVCGAHTWQVVVTFFYNLVVYFQLFFFYFLQFRHCTFERCSLDEFAPSLIEHLLEERFGINITKMPLGYVCVVKRKKGATGQPYPAAMTMFPLETLPWYIMVTDRAEDFSPYQRFLFLHEIGHSTVYHKISIERKISSPIQALLLLIATVMTAELSLLSASIIVVSLITWCVLVISSGASHEQHEILADRFPVLFLSKNELEEASRRYTDALKRRSDRPETIRQVELLEDAVGKRLSAIVDETPAELQHEFNQFAIRHFWPKWHAHLPLGVALIVAALHVTAVTWNSVIVLSLVVLPLPVVISFVIRMLVVIYEVRVNYILRIGEVPPRMVPDFYRRWESVKSNFHHR